jgi:hypothetical protein
MSFVIRWHHRLIFTKWITFLISVTTIWRMLTLGIISEDQIYGGLMMQQLGDGGTFRQVGATLDVHHIVITRALGRYRLHGTPARRHAEGRQRITTPAQDRFIFVQAHLTRFSTAISLWNDHVNAAGVLISTQTVCRRLHEGILRSRKTCICIPRTCRHRQARLRWTIEHTRWTM